MPILKSQPSAHDFSALTKSVQLLEEWRNECESQERQSLAVSTSELASGDAIQDYVASNRLKEEFGKDVCFDYSSLFHYQNDSTRVILQLPSTLSGDSVGADIAPSAEPPAQPTTETVMLSWDTEKPVDVHWLTNQCTNFLIAKADSGGQVGMTPEELTQTLYTILRSSKSDTELQSELFDLLGMESFDFVQLLLERRPEVWLFAPITCSSFHQCRLLVLLQILEASS